VRSLSCLEGKHTSGRKASQELGKIDGKTAEELEQANLKTRECIGNLVG